MIPNKDRILDHMVAAQYRPAKLKELAREMGVEQAEYRAFRSQIRSMVEIGDLVRGRNNRYIHPERIEGITGVLKVQRKGFGFVVRKGSESDIFIPRGGMGTALDGDLVRLELNGLWSREGLRQGFVVEVVAEGQKEFVGILRKRNRHWIIDVDHMALERDIIIDPAGIKGVEEGYRVVARVVDRQSGYSGLRGEIVEVIGDPDDPALDFDSVVRRFELPVQFSDEALADVEKFDVRFAAELERRIDFRDLPCCTIDPKEARDHDDAVSLRRRDEGGYRLLVHIADVSHYIRKNTAIDTEALERGTSAYLINRVIHMLPEELAAEKCSLVPGEDRLALSVDIALGDDGQVVSSAVCETVIRSAARLSYEEVQAVLDSCEEGAGEAAPWRDELLLMAELCQKRAKIRTARGSLALDLPEAMVELDAKDRPLNLGVYPRYLSNRIIEEFMLVANECVGRFCTEKNLPVLYRVHLPPAAQKLDAVFELIPGAQTASANAKELTPRDMQKLLEQAKGQANAALVSKLLLRSLSRAEYAGEDRGHFGLACNNYLHFTSPIRRYPDLLVHRVVKAALNSQWGEREDSEMRGQLVDLGKKCSTLERRAEAAERTYVKIKQMRYMERRVGEEFAGIVSGVLRSGFFVEVGDFQVDGFCFVRDLEEYVEYDEKKHRLVGRRSRRIIQLGMPVRVVVSAVDWNAMEMDLLLCDGTTPTTSTATKQTKNKKTAAGKKGKSLGKKGKPTLKSGGKSKRKRR
jgi:ribonuclease R